jgi:hypothetical protein
MRSIPSSIRAIRIRCFEIIFRRSTIEARSSSGRPRYQPGEGFGVPRDERTDRGQGQVSGGGGGAFPDGKAEAHIKADIPAAKKVFGMADTDRGVGVCVGAALDFPGASIDKEFAAAAWTTPSPMPIV